MASWTWAFFAMDFSPAPWPPGVTCGLRLGVPHRRMYLGFSALLPPPLGDMLTPSIACVLGFLAGFAVYPLGTGLRLPPNRLRQAISCCGRCVWTIRPMHGSVPNISAQLMPLACF